MLRSRFGTFFCLSLILILSLVFRSTGFWTAHGKPRELLQAALAMKLDQKGSTHFNIQSVGLKRLAFKSNTEYLLVFPFDAKDDAAESRYSASLFGQAISQLPFYYEPSFFAMSLLMSHRIFAVPGQPLTLLQKAPGAKMWNRDLRLWHYQFWAVFLPFAASCLSVLLVYVLGRRLWGVSAGVLAALFSAVNPLEIFYAAQVSPESYFCLWIALAFWIFWEAVARKSPWGCFWAGIVYALALLTRRDALLFLPSVWIFSVWVQRQNHPEKSWIRLIFNWNILAFLGGFYFIAGHWFAQMQKHYGHPLFMPAALERLFEAPPIVPSFAKESSWRGLIQTVAAWPVIFLALAGFAGAWTDRRKLFLWLWILPAALCLGGSADSGAGRWMPLFPALALLAAQALIEFKPRFYVSFFIVSLFCSASLWAAWRGILGS